MPETPLHYIFRTLHLHPLTQQLGLLCLADALWDRRYVDFRRFSLRGTKGIPGCSN